MKNRFLVMAVLSALVAVVVLPSAVLAQTSDSSEVSAVIDPGTFTFVAVGEFTSGIELSTLGTVPTTTASSTFTTSSTSYFILTDADDVDGATVRLNMSSTNTGAGGSFYYSGTAVGQDDLAVSSFRYIPNTNSSTGATIAPAAGKDDTPFYTWSVITASSSAAASATSLYSFPSAATGNSTTASGPTSASDYFLSSASTPVKGTLRIDKFYLSIPAYTSPGTYKSILQVVATAG